MWTETTLTTGSIARGMFVIICVVLRLPIGNILVASFGVIIRILVQIVEATETILGRRVLRRRRRRRRARIGLRRARVLVPTELRIRGRKRRMMKVVKGIEERC